MKFYIRIVFSILLCAIVLSCVQGSGHPVLPEPDDPLQVFNMVLQNEIQFYEYNGFVYWKDYDLFELCPGVEVEFAIVDLDGNETPELVLYFSGCGISSGPNISLVLRCEKGVVYGNSLGIRQMGGIKTDGSFYWSGGAGNNGIGTLQFAGATCETIYLAVQDYDPPERELYLVNGDAVTYAEFDAFCAAQDEKEDVVWWKLKDDGDIMSQYVRQP